MKKNLFLVVALFTVFFITGCEEVPENITLTGYKNFENGDVEEIVYEWYFDDPETVIKTTHIYTYEDGSNTLYNLKIIDCENYQRQGSLYKCKVEKSNGKVIYKEIVSKDSKATFDNIKNNLISSGYLIR